MTYHRCDVCRDEFTDKEKLTTIEGRVNLYQMSADPEKNHVIVRLDLCAKTSCRTTGIKQVVEAVGLQALETAGLSTSVVKGR